jgi:hypothetical protein
MTILEPPAAVDEGHVLLGGLHTFTHETFAALRDQDHVGTFRPRGGYPIDLPYLAGRHSRAHIETTNGSIIDVRLLRFTPAAEIHPVGRFCSSDPILCADISHLLASHATSLNQRIARFGAYAFDDLVTYSNHSNHHDHDLVIVISNDGYMVAMRDYYAPLPLPANPLARFFEEALAALIDVLKADDTGDDT